MSKAKKQHYVPQFLLKKFAFRKKPTAQVWVMDKLKEKCFLSSTKDIAHENRFYECQNGDGDTPLNDAVGCGGFEVVKFLLTKGADITIKNKKNQQATST